MATGRVKERHGNQHRALRRVRIRRGRCLTTTQHGACARVSGADEVRQNIALRAERALGFACGAGRIKNRRVVFGHEFGVGQRRVHQLCIAGRQSDDRLHRHSAAQFHGSRARHNQGVELQRVEMWRQPLKPLTIDDNNL